MALTMPAVRPRTVAKRLRTPAFPRLQAIPRLSVVVVNYQRWTDTVALVRDLHASEQIQQGGAEIIVIDNNSRRDCRSLGLPSFDTVTLRRSRRNRGYARAVNAGSRLCSGDWLLLLNPDMSAPQGFLDSALALAEQALRGDPTLGIIGFQVRNSDGTVQGSTGPFPTFLGTLARR